METKIEHKEELHKRIIERRDSLSAMHKQLAADQKTLHGEQLRAVDAALAIVEIHLKADWASVGEVESAELARWLESTRNLSLPVGKS